MSKIKPFMDKHNWYGINYPSIKDKWKKIEKKNNNLAFALNI